MRITKKDLNAVVERINSITNQPTTSYTKTKLTGGKKYVANVGNYHLDSAYGGTRLVQMDNESGGIRVIIDGFTSKRELYDKMQAFISGLTTTQRKE